MDFTCTPRGARLARRMVAHRLHAWGHPYGSEAHDTMTLIAAELASNAVRHGRVPGRDFRLCLTATASTLRIAVSDPGEDVALEARVPAPDTEHGRGLLLVSRLADRWTVTGHPPGIPGKTVSAEILLTPATRDSDSAGAERQGRERR